MDAHGQLSQKVRREPSTSSSKKRTVSPEEIMCHLFQEYKVGKDNTQLLSEVLSYATSDQLEIAITQVYRYLCLTIRETNPGYDRHFTRNVKPLKRLYRLKFHGHLQLPIAIVWSKTPRMRYKCIQTLYRNPSSF